MQEQTKCELHNLPFKYISFYDQENIMCEKCAKNEPGIVNVKQVIEKFSQLEPQQNKSVLKMLSNIEKTISTMKSKFFQSVELCWKQFKEEIQTIRQKMITPELVNFYTTKDLMREDLEYIQQIFRANFDVDFKKTKFHLEQQIKIIKYKFNKVRKVKIKLDNLFNPDYYTPSCSDQDLSEDPLEEDEYQYVISQKIEQERKISTITFNYDNEFVFVAGESLPLTAYEIKDKKLIPYQTLIDSKGWQIQAVASQTQNKIYCAYNDKLEIWQYQNTKWVQEHFEQFDQRVLKIALSISQKLCLTKMKSIEIWNLESEKTKMDLPNSHKEIIRQISFNYDGSLLASCCTKNLIIWKINEINVTQIIDQQRIIGVQFSNTQKNLICSILDNGDILIWSPDNQGIFYQQQWINRSSCTYGCQIRFYKDDSGLLIGTHSLEIYKQDEYNSNEWTQQQQIKINCWNFDVSINKKYIVADDFNKIVLLCL